MPAWATIVLALGTALIAVAGTLLATRQQHTYGQRDRELDERKELRERGAAVLTPISSLLSECRPSQLVIGVSDLAVAGVFWFEKLAQVDERLPAVRDQLLQYANAHPMPEMAEAGQRLAAAATNAVRTTMWLLDQHMKVPDKRGDLRFYLDAARAEHAHADRLLQTVLTAARGELDGPALTARLGEIETTREAEEERFTTEAESRVTR